MTDQQFGALIRFVRIRLRWRQCDLARRASVSQTIVSRIERGHLGSVPLDTIRRVAAALDIRVDVIGRWRGGDSSRLLNARHSALNESVIRALRRPGWSLAPEVSFSIYGERGVIDLLAWNSEQGTLLVIELKTEIVDVNELVGTFDRKIRLAVQIARDHGWAIESGTAVSAWLIVSDTRTNRRRVQDHAGLLRAAYPGDGRAVRRWLANPHGAIRGLSFWPSTPATRSTAVKRVSIRRAAPTAPAPDPLKDRPLSSSHGGTARRGFTPSRDGSVDGSARAEHERRPQKPGSGVQRAEFAPKSTGVTR
jgi:transcriptional regulator with XRE-family HTH domain